MPSGLVVARRSVGAPRATEFDTTSVLKVTDVPAVTTSRASKAGAADATAVTLMARSVPPLGVSTATAAPRLPTARATESTTSPWPEMPVQPLAVTRRATAGAPTSCSPPSICVSSTSPSLTTAAGGVWVAMPLVRLTRLRRRMDDGPSVAHVRPTGLDSVESSIVSSPGTWSPSGCETQWGPLSTVERTVASTPSLVPSAGPAVEVLSSSRPSNVDPDWALVKNTVAESPPEVSTGRVVLSVATQRSGTWGSASVWTS